MDAADGPPPTTADLLWKQFYQWESRGRGWMVFQAPVELEPLFRPFEGHYLPRRFCRDDGVQETGGSRFASRVLGMLGVRQEPPVIAPEPADEIEEPQPKYLDGREELVELQVALPADYEPSGKVFEQCMASRKPQLGSGLF